MFARPDRLMNLTRADQKIPAQNFVKNLWESAWVTWGSGK
jgi:hypothetical protein